MTGLLVAATATDWIAAGAAVVAAVGTVGALFAALFQIKVERDARKEQKHRAQAELVSAWPAADVEGMEGETIVALSNQSQAPVYRVVVSLVLIQGAGPKTGRELHEQLDEIPPGHQGTLALIPPGLSYAAMGGGWRGMHRQIGVELAFTDLAGVHWLRSSDGTLTELPEPPVEYYGLGAPYDWVTPTAAESLS